jgi:hypothetical protein
MNRRLPRPRHLPCVRPVLLSCAALLCTQAHADWRYSIHWPTGAPASTAYAQSIDTAVGSALGLWARHLSGGADVEVQLEFTDSVRGATGASFTSKFVRHEGSYTLYEQGLAYEIRTGIDPNGTESDVRIRVNADYCANELWFDPEPTLRRAAVPENRTDAVSLFAHEIGHALGFSGWWGVPDASSRRDYASTWDQNTRYDGSALYFAGPAATALYGAAVPITLGNNWHVGNATGPGSDLLSDLMNGVTLQRGLRYGVSPLDLAMLEDMGIALAPVPEPGTWALMLMGLAAVTTASRKCSPAGRLARSSSSISS